MEVHMHVNKLICSREYKLQDSNTSGEVQVSNSNQQVRDQNIRWTSIVKTVDYLQVNKAVQLKHAHLYKCMQETIHKYSGGMQI